MANATCTPELWPLVRSFISLVDSPSPVIVASISIDRDGFLTRGVLPDGREWAVMPLLYGGARLGVWRPGVSVAGTFDDEWSYDNAILAILSVEIWALGDEAEPNFWKRNNGSGRRRRWHRDGTYEEEERA